jgi:hypothetical protein
LLLGMADRRVDVDLAEVPESNPGCDAEWVPGALVVSKEHPHAVGMLQGLVVAGTCRHEPQVASADRGGFLAPSRTGPSGPSGSLRREQLPPRRPHHHAARTVQRVVGHGEDAHGLQFVVA